MELGVGAASGLPDDLSPPKRTSSSSNPLAAAPDSPDDGAVVLLRILGPLSLLKLLTGLCPLRPRGAELRAAEALSVLSKLRNSLRVLVAPSVVAFITIEQCCGSELIFFGLGSTKVFFVGFVFGFGSLY
jgi:hypothetical protein